MIASILSAAGYRTGLYTSPHLVSFQERIRIGGRPVTRMQVARLTDVLRPLVEKENATFFETVTAMAFKYFSDQKVDIAVVETGLGGRLDATNVLSPSASVITSISREHTEILGNLIRDIAYEKAGIIKGGTPCITGVNSQTALGVIHRTAGSRGAAVFHTRNVVARIRRADLSGSRVDFCIDGITYDRVNVSLPGIHQVANAKSALLTLHTLARKGELKIPVQAIRRGFAQVSRRSGLRSRLSVVHAKTRLILDVAHNPDAMNTLVGELKRFGVRKCVLVFGVMADKDFGPMIASLKPITSSAVVVEPSTPRARRASDMLKVFKRNHIPVFFAGPVPEGLAVAQARAGKERTVLITGSHFVVGEVLAVMEGKNYLTINQ